ncbi:META domain-containing protein [Gordonia sp. PKS22-38]|uniref:META domain-containing protein n=1 Tax=Gordonia prachuapensis TaxID=3115651 RepID=A0ABU7MXF2_9ACTN|nr:META domain-containing protein [Gordonia sp. PKS22-38]
MLCTGAQTVATQDDHPISRGAPERGNRQVTAPKARGSLRSVLLAVAFVALIAPVVGIGAATAAPVPVPPAPIRPAPVPPVLPDDPYTLLAGNSYSSIGVIGGAIPGGGPLTVTFAEDERRVGLDAGCNQHAGAVTVNVDQLRIDRLASTMMACPAPRSEADGWLTRFTSVPLTWRVLGPVLALSSPVQTVVLVEQQPSTR